MHNANLSLQYKLSLIKYTIVQFKCNLMSAGKACRHIFHLLHVSAHVCMCIRTLNNSITHVHAHVWLTYMWLVTSLLRLYCIYNAKHLRGKFHGFCSSSFHL